MQVNVVVVVVVVVVAVVVFVVVIVVVHLMTETYDKQARPRFPAV